MKSIKLADGRVLAYRDYGNPDGQPVLFIHGFADSGVVRYHDDAYTAAIGARIIAPDLPGVGGSSPDRGRTVSRWAGDARQLVDQLVWKNSVWLPFRRVVLMRCLLRMHCRIV